MCLRVIVVEIPETASLDSVALNKRAKQSSTSDGMGAYRAVDGHSYNTLTGMSCSYTASEVRPWWLVLLKGVYLVREVEITSLVKCKLHY